jgi:hypothetical protein
MRNYAKLLFSYVLGMSPEPVGVRVSRIGRNRQREDGLPPRKTLSHRRPPQIKNAIPAMPTMIGIVRCPAIAPACR